MQKIHDISQSSKTYTFGQSEKLNEIDDTAKSYNPNLSEFIAPDARRFLLTENNQFLITESGDYLVYA